MNLVTVRELYKNRDAYFNQEVTIGGWVRNNRDSKSFGFLVVSDGSFLSLSRQCTTIPWKIS